MTDHPDHLKPTRRDHAVAAAIFGAIVALWGGGMLWALDATAAGDTDTGAMVSVFNPGDAPAAMTAIRASGGRLVDNPVVGTWVVHGAGEGFAGRLRDAGAIAVFRQMPFALPGASGCFFLPDGQLALFTRWESGAPI